MTDQKMVAKYNTMRELASRMAETFQDMCKEELPKGGLMGAFYYEGQRRLEEMMHRVGDCMAYLMQRTEEGLARTAEQALKQPDGGADGSGPKLVVLGGNGDGNSPAKG